MQYSAGSFSDVDSDDALKTDAVENERSGNPSPPSHPLSEGHSLEDLRYTVTELINTPVAYSQLVRELEKQELCPYISPSVADICLSMPDIREHIICSLNSSGTDTYPPLSKSLANRIAGDASAGRIMAMSLVTAADTDTVENFVQNLFASESGRESVLRFIEVNSIEPLPSVQCVDAAMRTKHTQLYLASILPTIEEKVFKNALVSEMIMCPAYLSLLVQKLGSDRNFLEELMKNKKYTRNLLQTLKQKDLLPRPSVTARNVEKMLGTSEMRDLCIKFLREKNFLPCSSDDSSESGTARADKMLAPGPMRDYIVNRLQLALRDDADVDDAIDLPQTETALACEYRAFPKPVIVTIADSNRKVTSVPKPPQNYLFRFDPASTFPAAAKHSVDCILAARLTTVHTPRHGLIAQNIIAYGTFSDKVATPASATPFVSNPSNANKRKVFTDNPDDSKKFKLTISDGCLPVDAEDADGTQEEDQEEIVCAEYIKQLQKVIAARGSAQSAAAIAAKLSASRLVTDESVPASADSFLQCVLRFFPSYSSVAHLREKLCDYIEAEAPFVKVCVNTL